MSTNTTEIRATILLDSITERSSRLITWLWEAPRIILAEINTHRASSRAIPAAKLRERIMSAPFVPIHWGKNQAGMQAHTELTEEEQLVAKDWWLSGRDMMARHHRHGEAIGLHKQIINRVIEPWMYCAQIVSITDHANFFHLRNHVDAEPHFRELARQSYELFHSHMPTYRAPGEWHLPMIDAADFEIAAKTLDVDLLASHRLVEDYLKKVSVGRCARVSYLTHDGKRDLAEDVALHDKLAATASEGTSPMHASPLEHQAQAVGGRVRYGNFEGWRQYRYFFKHENGPDTTMRCERCGCWDGRHATGCAL